MSYDFSKKWTADEHASTSEPEILPPSVSRQQWAARPAQSITVPNPVMRDTFFGRPNHADYRRQVQQVNETETAITALVRTRTEKEHATIEYERTLARRESMVGLLEQDRLKIGVGIAEAKVELKKAIHELERQDEEAINNDRLRELHALDYQAHRAQRQQTLAEETAKAGSAEEIATLKAAAEKARARRELQEEQNRLEAALAKAERTRRAREADLDEADDGDPEEFRQAMKTQRKRDNINRAAAKREAEILKRVDGDESLLDEEEVDELEGIRQARARAQQSVDKDSALGAIFPDDEGEEEKRS
jgi:hypothetical protein